MKDLFNSWFRQAAVMPRLLMGSVLLDEIMMMGHYDKLSQFIFIYLGENHEFVSDSFTIWHFSMYSIHIFEGCVSWSSKPLEGDKYFLFALLLTAVDKFHQCNSKRKLIDSCWKVFTSIFINSAFCLHTRQIQFALQNDPNCLCFYSHSFV